MLKTLKADLHIHTCLSPCGELEMSPTAIAHQAKIKEIDIIGICDHNSAENVQAVIKAAQKFKINVLPGIEVTSQEEVHILALFDEVEEALKLQQIIYENLAGENDEETFGLQVVVNERGEVLGFNKKLLIGACALSVEEVVSLIHSLNGLAIASHIDREAFSLIAQLGFIPENLEFDALEISPALSYGEAQQKFKLTYPLVSFSDAHFLREMGRGLTLFYIEEGNIQEIKKAFLNKDGRKVIQ